MAENEHTLDVWGDLACFTRSELKVERFSYPVITPSAARGIFDAIYWDGLRETKGNATVVRPYFYWQVMRVEVLRLPCFIALRRNEVKDRVPGERTVQSWMRGQTTPVPIWADASKDELGTDQKGRTQRQTMALKNVRYRLTARLVAKPGFVGDYGKFNACFKRRASQGKCFQQPYFGCREFPAFFEYVDDPLKSPVVPATLNQRLGLMLYDVFDLRLKTVSGDMAKPFITLFEAEVKNGVMDVPPFESDLVRKPGRA
ncbi:MAG: type I-C CRISPR-associated protein Cas5c [Solidesulfovibrio sp.]